MATSKIVFTEDAKIVNAGLCGNKKYESLRAKMRLCRANLFIDYTMHLNKIIFGLRGTMQSASFGEEFALFIGNRDNTRFQNIFIVIVCHAFYWQLFVSSNIQSCSVHFVLLLRSKLRVWRLCFVFT